MLVVGCVLVALLTGFVLGGLALKRSERWCPLCGEAVRCPSCPGKPTPMEARRALWCGSARPTMPRSRSVRQRVMEGGRR